MKIAVVGCGALGSYYGAKLSHAGQDVHLLLRSDYEVVRRKGVYVRSDEGDVHATPNCARTPEDIGVCDLVLIGLKTTANDQFANLVPPLVGDKTAIFTLQNGLGNEEILASLFGKDKILGGLCFVCLNRVEPGVIQQVGRGRILMGEFSGKPEPRTHDIAAMFRNAGVLCEVTENLEQAHWEKLVWNVPFNGLGVAGAAGFEAVSSGDAKGVQPGRCLSTKDLLSDERWEKLVRELMDEVIATAQALGLNVQNSTAEKELIRTRQMGDYKASTLIDFERRQPLELVALFLESLRQARQAGAATPRLEKLCAVLLELDPVLPKPVVL